MFLFNNITYCKVIDSRSSGPIRCFGLYNSFPMSASSSSNSSGDIRVWTKNCSESIFFILRNTFLWYPDILQSKFNGRTCHHLSLFFGFSIPYTDQEYPKTLTPILAVLPFYKFNCNCFVYFIGAFLYIPADSIPYVSYVFTNRYHCTML